MTLLCVLHRNAVTSGNIPPWAKEEWGGGQFLYELRSGTILRSSLERRKPLLANTMAGKHWSEFTSFEDKRLQESESKGSKRKFRAPQQQQAFGFHLLPFLLPITWLLWVQGNSIRLGIRPKQAAEQPWLRIWGMSLAPALLAASQLWCSSTYMGQLQAQLSHGVNHTTAALEIETVQ